MTTKKTPKLKKGQKIVFRRFNGVKAAGLYQRAEDHVNGRYLELKVGGAPLKIRVGQVLSVDGVPAA